MLDVYRYSELTPLIPSEDVSDPERIVTIFIGRSLADYVPSSILSYWYIFEKVSRFLSFVLI